MDNNKRATTTITYPPHKSRGWSRDIKARAVRTFTFYIYISIRLAKQLSNFRGKLLNDKSLDFYFQLQNVR